MTSSPVAAAAVLPATWRTSVSITGVPAAPPLLVDALLFSGDEFIFSAAELLTSPLVAAGVTDGLLRRELGEEDDFSSGVSHTTTTLSALCGVTGADRLTSDLTSLLLTSLPLSRCCC